MKEDTVGGDDWILANKESGAVILSSESKVMTFTSKGAAETFQDMHEVSEHYEPMQAKDMATDRTH